MESKRALYDSLEGIGEMWCWNSTYSVYNFIVTSISNVRRAKTYLLGSRLHWVLSFSPSHIPTKVYDEFQSTGKPAPTGKIPGYAGYVPSIKPENLYSDTFGKTTHNVDNQSLVKGQDFEARNKYVSTQTSHFLPPSERFQRTAADIVGVPPTKIDVKAVTLGLFSQTSSAQEKKSISSPKANHRTFTKAWKAKIPNGVNPKSSRKKAKSMYKLDNLYLAILVLVRESSLTTSSVRPTLSVWKNRRKTIVLYSMKRTKTSIPNSTRTFPSNFDRSQSLIYNLYFCTVMRTYLLQFLTWKSYLSYSNFSIIVSKITVF